MVGGLSQLERKLRYFKPLEDEKWRERDLNPWSSPIWDSLAKATCFQLHHPPILFLVVSI